MKKSSAAAIMFLSIATAGCHDTGQTNAPSQPSEPQPSYGKVVDNFMELNEAGQKVWNCAVKAADTLPNQKLQGNPKDLSLEYNGEAHYIVQGSHINSLSNPASYYPSKATNYIVYNIEKNTLTLDATVTVNQKDYTDSVSTKFGKAQFTPELKPDSDASATVRDAVAKQKTAMTMSYAACIAS